MKPSTLSVTEAAAELGISPARVRVLIAGGRLKARRIGPRILLIERADLRAVRSRPAGRPKAAAEPLKLTVVPVGPLTVEKLKMTVAKPGKLTIAKPGKLTRKQRH